MEGENLGCGVS